MNYAKVILVFIVLLTHNALAGPDFVIPAGEYEIIANTSLPHIQDNLAGLNTRELRCLNQPEAGQLFPILDHPSFTDCSLEHVSSVGDDVKRDAVHSLDLVCRNKRAATGKAQFNIEQARFSALLSIKMGAKNMTMIQNLRARMVSPCHRQ